MIEVKKYKDDVFILWPSAGLWVRRNHDYVIASLLIAWGFWGVEVKWLKEVGK